MRERLALTGDPFTPPSPFPLTLQVRERLALTGDPGPLAYARTPLVDLPLGATEDRVCGTIDFERALMEGGSAVGGWWLAAVLPPRIFQVHDMRYTDGSRARRNHPNYCWPLMI